MARGENLWLWQVGERKINSPAGPSMAAIESPAGLSMVIKFAALR